MRGTDSWRTCVPAEPGHPTGSVARSSLLVVAAAVLWGTSGAAQELGPPDINPPAVATLRSLLGGSLLVAVVVIGRGGGGLVRVLRHAPGAAVGAAVAMSLFQLGYFGGIRLAGVAVGTLVAIGSAPVTAGLLDLLRGHRPTRRWAVATAITILGTALLVAPGAGGDAVRPAGVALALVAGASYASYAVVSKQLLDAGVASTTAMAAAFVGASVLLSPTLLVVDLRWAASPRGATVLLWLGVMTIALGYILFARGLGGLQPSTATTLTLAEPLTAALIAVLVLGERLSGPALGGAVLVATGLVLAGGGRRAPNGPGRLRRRGRDH
jgi:drug/metabolite transporter, DME family